MLKKNDRIPNFEILTDKGEFKVSDYIGKKIVIFFFPKADTSGCTAEAIAFTNLHKKFEKLNCIVIGISKDNQKTQTKFREKHSLKCELGADFENNICEQFGVWSGADVRISCTFQNIL